MEFNTIKFNIEFNISEFNIIEFDCIKLIILKNLYTIITIC
jgi:hypothetical protein